MLIPPNHDVNYRISTGKPASSRGKVDGASVNRNTGARSGTPLDRNPGLNLELHLKLVS